MANLDIYNKCKVVPKEAQKTITGGRLKGMTDINPMWRIKVLTEQFGPCGLGWYYDIIDSWSEPVSGSEEIAVFIKIKLFINLNGDWSQGIVGLGGSKIAAAERGGLYVDDECYKKALTDAISVSCKALGIGADIYWDKDGTKYSQIPGEGNKAKESEKLKQAEEEPNPVEAPAPVVKLTSEQAFAIHSLLEKTGVDVTKFLGYYKAKTVEDMTADTYEHAAAQLNKRLPQVDETEYPECLM